MKIGIITGSGFYDFPDLINPVQETIQTQFGDVPLMRAAYKEHTLYFLARHGQAHRYLPNMINYRANTAALHACGVSLIIGTSVMGILRSDIPMANIFLFDDLFFPENRLPDGDICSMFTEPGEAGRGHHIFNTPFAAAVNALAIQSAEELSIPFQKDLVYAHVNGPRFNTRAEIAMFKNAGCHAVSQTAGPEIVLAGECEIGYLLLGFGTDYANGIQAEPTPIAVLTENMGKSKRYFTQLIFSVCDKLQTYNDPVFEGFIYRFENA